MSSINPNNIDGTYPIAGQDNDSQGFRDNFTNIKNNFTFAYNELADLQNNAILKSALSGTTLNNNLNNAQLIGAQISKFTQTRNDIGTQTGPVTVNWSDALFQTLTTSGSVTLTFANWPTSGFWTNFVLEINVTNVAHTLTLPASVSVNVANIQGISGSVITFPATGIYKFEFSTYDGGTTVTIRDLLRSYAGNLAISTITTTSGNLTIDPAGFATVNIVGDLNIYGNVTRQGGQIDAAYQYYSPSGNLVFTANTNTSRVILDPATPTVSLYANITLPAGNVDAKIVTISSTQTVQFLSVWPSLGTTLVNVGNITLTGGTSVQYFYHASEGKWYKIG